MNTHDIKLPQLPDIPAAICPWNHSERVVKNLLEAYATAAIEADRQSRDCGKCVPLSTDGKSVFIDGVGEVPLDFGGQAMGEPVAWEHRFRALPDGPWAVWGPGRAPSLRTDKYEVQERALYTDPQVPQTPEGYKLVPIEPTIEQTFFGVAEWRISEDPEEEVRRIYKAMLEAAPNHA